ncbi:MAG: thioredoxin family protein [Coriobacteriia bacterium]|nr:thioredoxin family protein [Coriobacteriia bacterium]
MELYKLTSAELENKVYDLEESCLVIFFRKNCHVCEEVKPMLEDLAEDYSESPFCFYAADVEEQPNLTLRFPIKGTPTILFFSKGEYQGKLAGGAEEEEVTEMIESLS